MLKFRISNNLFFFFEFMSDWSRMEPKTRKKNTVGVFLDIKSAGNAFAVLVLNGKVVRNVIIDENPRYLFEIQLRYRHWNI